MADDAGYTFGPQSVARIAAAVQRSEAGAPVPTRGDPGAALRSPQARFTARITGTSGTGYSWARVVEKADGTHADYSPSQTGTGNAFELNGGTANTGDVVELVYAGRKTDGTTPGYWFATKGGALPVTLTWNAGSDGNGTTACTWTYDVKDAAGAFIKQPSGANMAAVAPAHNRSYGKTIKATMGTLRRKADGTWELYQTDEISNFKVCV